MTAEVAASRLFRIRVASASVVFAASIVLYTATLAPTVTLVDSGELIVAARSLGVAHPPGFPLYVLLAHLATLLPIGSVAVRVNCASALFAALASAALALALIEALLTPAFFSASDRARKKTEKAAKKKSPSNNFDDPLVLIISSVGAGLLLAFSRTLWAYATIAEVYSLNSLLIVVMFLLVFRWRREVLQTRVGRSAPEQAAGARARSRRPICWSSTDRLLYAAALFFGLGLGVHHVTVGLMLPAVAALVLATEGLAFLKSRRLGYTALWSLAGLSVYVYLPFAASRSPVMNWGDPRTLERFWWHVTGRQYRVFFVWSVDTVASQLGDFMKLSSTQFGPAWLPVALALVIAGGITIHRQHKPLFWFLSLAIAADLIYCLGYEIAEDKDAYYLPAIIAASIAAGFGAWWLMREIPARMGIAVGRARYVASAATLLVLMTALVANLPFNNRSRYFIAEDYLENIYSSIEPGGMLLTRDWQVYSPSLYLREIERRREDVVAIDVNQLRRSWYFDYLEKAYPSLIEEAKDKVDAFLEDLVHWERDPDLYQRDLTLNRRISSRFYEMILAFVTNHIKTAPVYVTLDIAANRDGEDSELTRSLSQSYQLVPQGLIFRATAERGFVEPAEPRFVTRGLADGTIRFEEGDVVKLKVLPVYATMCYNRGRYLAAHGRHEQAIEAFRQAIEFQPGFTPAQQAINDSLNAIRQTRPN
jgi:tetratricopeptide (TPR) repeat protein